MFFVKYILRMFLVVCLAGFILFSVCSCSGSKAQEPSDSELTDIQPPENKSPETEVPENSEKPEESVSSDEPEEPSAELPSDNSSSEKKITPLFNLNHIMKYISELPPSALGLSGSSMSEFRFYPSEGILQVGEVVFRQFIVYRVDEKTGVNVFVQAYLIDMNSRRLYKLDLRTKNVEMLPYVPET